MKNSSQLRAGKSLTMAYLWLDHSTLSIRASLQCAIFRELTERPHIAGNTSDIAVARLIYNRWKGYNFDKVETTNYTVLLQYPGNHSHPNQLQLEDSAGEVIYDAAIQREKPLLPLEEDPSVAPPFNAYSGTGNATVRSTVYCVVELPHGHPQGPLAYVNYGRLEDFLYVNRTLNISLEGRICIVRYGQIYRGDKVNLL